MQNFVNLSDNSYMGIRWGTPEGVEGVDWKRVDVAPDNALDTWDEGTQQWIPYAPPAPVYPTETILQDVDTGEPVKVMVKSGEVYIGGINETPSE